MIDNIGRGGLTNNIMTYVNKSGIEITRIMIAIRKTLMMTLMVAATAMMISILFCRWDKKNPRMTRIVASGVSVFLKKIPLLIK